MQVKFIELQIEDKNELIGFLISERWDYHSKPLSTAEFVNMQLNSGYFTMDGVRSFWICSNEKLRVGLIRLFDLGTEPGNTETPLFDIKIKKEFRGKGIGENAVNWLTRYVFTSYPGKNRFEATTRIDNTAMRRVLEKCGFVKEEHYRQGWPDEHGNKYDCAGYSILRSDWENNITTAVKFDS